MRAVGQSNVQERDLPLALVYKQLSNLTGEYGYPESACRFLAKKMPRVPSILLAACDGRPIVTAARSSLCRWLRIWHF